MSLTLKSPAKLNLFLHITGRRADGYHLIQSIFQLIDAHDELTFSVTDSSEIQLCVEDDIQLTNCVEDNLIYKAASLLKSYAPKAGVQIKLKKNLPVGGGIGAGSANAATTLIALNHLWQLNLPKHKLQSLALTLGADVPFFIFGHTAWVEGIGEQLTQLPKDTYERLLPNKTCICVLTPKVHMSTQSVFQHKSLVRDKKKVTVKDLWQPNVCENIFEKIVTQENKQIYDALTYLRQLPKKQLNSFIMPKMTGTGACVFAVFNDEEDASRALQNAPCDGLLTKPVYSSTLNEFI